MTDVLELLAILSAACFAGGALYASLVEHPARLEAGVSVAVAQFGASYPRGARWQGSLAALPLLCGLLSFAVSGLTAWAAGALTIGAVIPWTLLLMSPTNRHLLRVAPVEAGAPEARLFERWARLHAVRSLLGVAALLIFLLTVRT